MPNQSQLQRNRSRLSGLEVRDEAIVGLDLRYAVAQSSRWTNCTFERVRFSASNFGDATFDGCTFRKCRLDRAALVSRIYRTLFESCDFDETSFRGADIQESVFDVGRAHYSDWSRASLIKTRVNLDLRNALLTFNLTDGVDFTGSNLWSAAIPWNCASFVGNTFDERMIGGLAALMTHAKMPLELKARLDAVPSEHSKELVRRLVVAGDR